MHKFPYVASVFLVASLCQVSCFVVQIPPPSYAAATSLSTGSERVLRLQHARTAPSSLQGPNKCTGRSQEIGRTVMMAASRNGKGGDQVEEEKSEEKNGGTEAKYVAAIGVFALAALYDLFVTHQGRLWEL